MAQAIEMTIATGRTVYDGDPAHDERIRSREARVSVTWRLGEDEQDLALMASVLAEEAERALSAACRAARGRGEEPCQEEPCGQEVTPPPSANGTATNGATATASPGQSQHNGNHESGNNGSGSVPYSHGRTVAAPSASGSHRAAQTRAASRRKRSALAAPPAVLPPPSGEAGDPRPLPPARSPGDGSDAPPGGAVRQAGAGRPQQRGGRGAPGRPPAGRMGGSQPASVRQLTCPSLAARSRAAG